VAPSRRSDPAALFEAAVRGDRVALARLLSLVERGGEPSRAVASLSFRSPGDAYSVGITGAPGAGKSTLTDRLVAVARSEGFEGGSGGASVAVLAIDPSSPFSGGAILGDRVRMQSHALDDGVFIRSMATRGHLGGLATAVPDAVRLLSAVGMPVVLVETVGVGQQEIEVAAATDSTIVVVNPGWGDAIQANKAGLLEIADLFVINKADRPGTRETRRDLESMLELTEGRAWSPPIVETVAPTGEGLEQLWKAIGAHREHQIATHTLEAVRHQRLEREFHQIVTALMGERLAALEVSDRHAELMAAMDRGEVDPYQAADAMLSEVMSTPASGATDSSR
jgi:LAO/AO transport system kinase